MTEYSQQEKEDAARAEISVELFVWWKSLSKEKRDELLKGPIHAIPTAYFNRATTTPEYDKLAHERGGYDLRKMADRLPTPEGYTSDGWISVDDRLPTFAEDAEDDGVKVYTWDGELVTEDEFMPEYEQPAGPAVGGWMRTGEWFASDNLHRVTHWMLRRLPAGPVAAATAKDKP